MAKVVCPFCFQEVEVNPGDCCPGNSAKKSKGVGRWKAIHFLQESIRHVCQMMLGRGRFSTDNSTVVDECPSARHRIILPPEVFTHELFPIVVIGGKSAGKTVYLTAMAKELIGTGWKYWEAKLIHYQGNPFEDSMAKMFQKKLFPNPTDRDEHPPLLVSLRKTRPWWWPWPLPMRKPLLLCYTDPAGEHFGLSAKDRGELLQKYPVLGGRTKAVIAVMDPTEVSSEWKKLLLAHWGLTSAAVAGNANVSQSLSALTMMPGHKKIPVAVCMTKLDETVGAKSPLNADASNKRGFDLTGVFRMDSTENDTYLRESGRFSWMDMTAGDKIIRRKLYDMSSFEMFRSLGVVVPRRNEPVDGLWGGQTLENAAFRYHAFFGVSATGLGRTKRKIDEPGLELDREKTLAPFRVLDPVFWILWQYGLLGSAKGRTT